MSAAVVQESSEVVAGMMELTLNAPPTSCGLKMTCSLVPGNAAYQPKLELPEEQAVLPFQQIVCELMSTIPDDCRASV